MKSPEDARQERGTEARRGADADVTSPQTVELRHPVDDLGEVGQHPAGHRQQGLPGVGHRHRAGPPVEERRAEAALQLADLGAHGGLRHVQAIGGAGELALLGDGDEVLELVNRRQDAAMVFVAASSWPRATGTYRPASR